MRGTARMLCMSVLCMSSGLAHAQAIQSIEITEYGIYTTETATSAAAPGTASGKLDQVTNIKLLQSTASVPAHVGIEFGFRYKINGQPAAAPPPKTGVNLKYVTHIPKPGMRNPETGNVTLTNIFYQEHKVGEELYRLYRLVEPWEIVPGIWTLEIWDGDRKLLSQDFLVKK
jgi:hypothetical protein